MKKRKRSHIFRYAPTMDSEGTKRAAEMNGSRDEKNKLDLELRLGLPDNDDSQPKNQGQHFDPTLLAANDGVDLSHLAPRPQICLLQEENDNQVSQGGAHFNAGAWPLQSGIQDCYANPIEHHASPSIGIGLPPNQLPTSPGLPPTIVNNNLFVDMPQKNSMELGMASSSSGPKKPPAKRGRPRHGDTNNPNRRCTNPLCNAATSPMWRPGPLGPKTLCNACGIKYRKEEEKKKTQLIMQQLHELATARHNPTE